MNKRHGECDRTTAQRTGGRVPTLAGVLMLAFAVQGCESLGSHHGAVEAADVPAGWSIAEGVAANGPSPLVQWWTRFGDVELTALVDQALRANTSVAGAQAALRQAVALRDVSAAGLLPVIAGSASAQHSTGRNGAGNNVQAGLDANWEVDVFGANRSALRAAEATARASAATLGDVRVSIAAEVALEYIALRSAQARLEIARANLVSQQETLQLTQWRLQAGLVTSLEAEQARAATEQTSAQVPALQTGIEQSSHALAVLTGRPPAALSSELAPLGAVPQAADDLALRIPAETLRQRPDVRAAEDQVAAAVARADQADAARWPTFQLGGSVGLSAMTLGSLASRASVISALFASVSVPVFDGGAARAQVRAQEAALDQAQATYRSAILTALKDVEDALVALRGDRERLAHLEQAAEAASNAALLARQRYGSGLVDFQIVLETQRTQLSTQDGVASARADVSADHVRLYKALGGGWVPDPGDSTPAAADSAARAPRS